MFVIDWFPLQSILCQRIRLIQGVQKSTRQKLPTCKIDLGDVVEVVQGVSVHHVDVIVHEHERSETWDTGQP